LAKSDPISEFLTLASYAKDDLWPTTESERLGELNCRCGELRKAGGDCDWRPFYEAALSSAQNGLACLEDLQGELTRESVEMGSSSGTGAQTSAADVDTAVRRMKKEIEKAPNYLCGTSGRIARQENQIKESLSPAFSEFAVEERTTGNAIEIALEPQYRGKILQYIQNALESWRHQAIRDMPHFVPGEDPAVMEQLDSMAKEFNVYPFEFEESSSTQSSGGLDLDSIRGRVDVPKIGGLFFRTLRSSLMGIGILIGPIIAVAGLFLASDKGMTAGRGLVIAALLPILALATYLWARGQRQTMLNDLMKRERERMLEAFKRAVFAAVAKQKTDLEQVTRKYFIRATKSFRDWSDQLLVQAKDKQASQNADMTGKIKMRLLEINKQLAKIRMMTGNLTGKIIPALENRVAELSDG